MKILAQRFDENECAIIAVSCSDSENIKSSDDFLNKLKEAITDWTKNSHDGKKALEHSCGYFNFGDLYINFQNKDLVEILKKYEIFDLEAEMIILDEAFSIDTILVNE